MEPMRAEDLHGIEHDWLASDADGHVALFSTAGGGVPPADLVAHVAEHDAAIDAVLAMPASTHAVLAPSMPSGLENTWQLVAERGLHAFDSSPTGGPYRRAATPSTPIHVDRLPEPARTVARRLCLAGLRFAALEAVDVPSGV